MQDRTINNALTALRKQGGPQGKLAEVLLDLRGVEWSGYTQNQPLRRGEARRLVLDELKAGPKTNSELGQTLRTVRPDITPRAAANRSYQALLRLEDKGLVRRDGKMWKTN
jgi:hypothetical protein